MKETPVPTVKCPKEMRCGRCFVLPPTGGVRRHDPSFHISSLLRSVVSVFSPTSLHFYTRMANKTTGRAPAPRPTNSQRLKVPTFLCFEFFSEPSFAQKAFGKKELAAMWPKLLPTLPPERREELARVAGFSGGEADNSSTESSLSRQVSWVVAERSSVRGWYGFSLPCTKERRLAYWFYSSLEI